MTLTQLVKHYEGQELPTKASSTQRTLRTSLKIWVLPKWGELRLTDVKTVDVEKWLRGQRLPKNPFRLTEHCLKLWQTGADEHSTGKLMIGYLPVRSWTADSRYTASVPLCSHAKKAEVVSA